MCSIILWSYTGQPGFTCGYYFRAAIILSKRGNGWEGWWITSCDHQSHFEILMKTGWCAVSMNCGLWWSRAHAAAVPVCGLRERELTRKKPRTFSPRRAWESLCADCSRMAMDRKRSQRQPCMLCVRYIAVPLAKVYQLTVWDDVLRNWNVTFTGIFELNTDKYLKVWRSRNWWDRSIAGCRITRNDLFFKAGQDARKWKISLKNHEILV